MEQYLAFVGGKPLAQIVPPVATPQVQSPAKTTPQPPAAAPPPVVTPPPAAKPVQQPALPPGPTQKEKDALVATLTAHKDTFPSMTPHSLPSLMNSPFDSPTTCSLTPSYFSLPFSQQIDQVPNVRKDLR